MADEKQEAFKAGMRKVLGGLADLIEQAETDPIDWPHPGGPGGPAVAPLRFQTTDDEDTDRLIMDMVAEVKVYVPLTRTELAAAIRRSLERTA